MRDRIQRNNVKILNERDFLEIFNLGLLVLRFRLILFGLFSNFQFILKFSIYSHLFSLSSSWHGPFRPWGAYQREVGVKDIVDSFCLNYRDYSIPILISPFLFSLLSLQRGISRGGGPPTKFSIYFQVFYPQIFGLFSSFGSVFVNSMSISANVSQLSLFFRTIRFFS